MSPNLLDEPPTTRSFSMPARRYIALALSALLVLACGEPGDPTPAPPSPTANDTVGAMPDYEGREIKTVMSVPYVEPVPSPRSTGNGKSYFGKFGYLRSWVIADLDGDGLDDIVVAPTFFDQKPDLAVMLWINRGDGTFENRTAQWFEGTVPTTSGVVAALVEDFNGDGRPDLFISDAGQELFDCISVHCPGALNRIFLSNASGRWVDATPGISNNPPRFNHLLTGLGDLNGDGFIDAAVPTLGEVENVGDGVVLLMNDGRGALADHSHVLSDEVGYRPFSYQFSGARAPTYDRQVTGAVAIHDLDGDGTPEFLSCTYSTADWYTKKKTLRIARWNAANQRVEEVARTALTGELAQLAGAGADGVFVNGGGLVGCAGIWAADFDRDGTQDLMLHWEEWGASYIQLLRGLGSLAFVDVTKASFGGFGTSFVDGPFLRNPLGYRFQDVNGDGAPDIVMLNSGLTSGRLATGSASVFINDGQGRFAPQRLYLDGRPASAATIEAITACDFCSHFAFFGRFLPRADGRRTLDLLLVNTNEDIGGNYPQERSLSLRVFKAR